MASIIAVHSFRGGTGKTNITANLAVTVARQDRRVGIVDTDIQSPGIHALFGFEEDRVERTLNDYLWGDSAIEDAAYDVSAELKDASGGPAITQGAVYLVPSSIRAGDIARVLREGYDVELLVDGFQRLIERLSLDYLFVDTHPGLNRETLLSMTLARQLVLILRPDRQDYQGTAVTVEIARTLDVPRMLLVVNKAVVALDFAALREQVERAYETPVAAILPLNDDVAQLASCDIFSLRSPDHPWSRAIREITTLLVDGDA